MGWADIVKFLHTPLEFTSQRVQQLFLEMPLYLAALCPLAFCSFGLWGLVPPPSPCTASIQAGPGVEHFGKELIPAPALLISRSEVPGPSYSIALL